MTLFAAALLALGLWLSWFGRNKRTRGARAGLPLTSRPGPARADTARQAQLDMPRLRGYAVSVGGSPAFTSLDDAERHILDRRWARAGCPRLGGNGRRPD